MKPDKPSWIPTATVILTAVLMVGAAIVPSIITESVLASFLKILELVARLPV